MDYLNNLGCFRYLLVLVVIFTIVDGFILFVQSQQSQSQIQLSPPLSPPPSSSFVPIGNNMPPPPPPEATVVIQLPPPPPPPPVPVSAAPAPSPREMASPPRNQPRRLRPPSMPPPPPPPPTVRSFKEAKKSGLNRGKTVGLVFAGFAAMLQICVVAFLVFKRRQLLRMTHSY